MEHLVFTHVPAAGFSAFDVELSVGAWGLVDVSGYEGTNQYALKPLGEAPVVVVLKLRLKWGIASLARAIEGAWSAKECDRKWDGCQKLLNAELGVAGMSNDVAKREAAARLQKLLLIGAGEGQTRLRYQQEVDFGRKQQLLISQGQAAADVALLGLGSVMLDIAQATDQLALAIGHGESAHAPYLRKAKATMACASAFGVVADMLGFMAEHGSAGADREQALALRGPLEELVARYPARAAGRLVEAPQAEAVTPPVT